MSGKQVRVESSNVVQNLQEEQVKNNEISPFNDVCHCKFLIHPGIIITDNNSRKTGWKRLRKVCSNFIGAQTGKITFEVHKYFSEKCTTLCTYLNPSLTE